MEGSAAVEIWKRSVERHRLVYSAYVGDGDSSSFMNLVKSDLYQGIETVRKEECLGHVQKRLKKHLKEKSDLFCKLSVGKIERVVQLYALVVAQNRGKTSNEIQNAPGTSSNTSSRSMRTAHILRSLGAIIRRLVRRMLKIQPLLFLLFGNPTSLTPNMDGRKKYLRPLLRSQCVEL